MTEITLLDTLKSILVDKPELILPNEEFIKEGYCFYCMSFGVEREAHYKNNRTVNALSLRRLDEDSDTCPYSTFDEYLAEHPNGDEVLYHYLQMNYVYERYFVQIEREMCLEHYNICEWCSEAYLQPNVDLDVTYMRVRNPRAYHFGYTGLHSWSNNERLCENCGDQSYHCSRCGDMIHSDDSHSIDNDVYCDGCASRWNTWWCEDCDTTHRDDCPEGNSADDEFYGNSRVGSVHDYNFKPDAIFGSIEEIDGSARETKHQVFMGFELEVESGSAWVSTLVDELNLHFGTEERYVYYKRDGSLSDGVEIVSHPSTLAYHKAQPLTKALEGLARLGAKSWRTSTCGLHVHISRRAFTSPSHIWKFTHFIVDNKPSMIKLAGRESRQWASFDDLNEFKGILNRAKGSRHYGRYEALNFGNYETIELRFFRGSLAPRRLYSALELTEGACEYTRNLTSQDVKEGALDFSEFVKWLQRNPEKYPNLLSLINHYDLSYASRVKTQPAMHGPTSDSEDYF